MNTMTHPLPQPSDEAVSRYIAAWDARPIRGMSDVIHAMHLGESFGAELKMSDLRALTAAHAALVAEVARLRGALLECARLADALKRPCSDYPDSVQAVRNAQYANISAAAHIALGTIRGPELTLLQRAEAAERERDELRQQLGVLLDAINLDHGKSLESLGPVAAVESVLHRAETWHRERCDTAQEIARLTAKLAQRDEAGARDEREACAQVCNAMVDLPLSEIPAATAFGRLYEAGIRRGLVAATNAIRARAAIDRAAKGKAK